MAQKPTKAATRKRVLKKRPRGGNAAKPKKQQATSANAILRERFKAMAVEYRVQGFTYTQITEAINAHFRPDQASEDDDLDAREPTPGFKPISRHHVCDLIKEAIVETVDPLKAEELLEITIKQLYALLSAMMGPAIQGSVPHTAQAQSLLRDIAKLLKLDGDGNEGGGGQITQIFLNGGLASC